MRAIRPEPSQGRRGPGKKIPGRHSLQLGRALVLSGERDRARSAYDAFLTLWKDADPDVPVLKEASAEYAKL